MGASQSRLPPLRLRACGAAKGHGLGRFAGRRQVPVQCTLALEGLQYGGNLRGGKGWLPSDRHVEIFYSVL